MKIIDITVLDSLLFLGTCLNKLPKMLGSSLSCAKAFHPYFYDLNYVGDIVDKKYFDLSNMTSVEKVEFENWYDSYRGKEYNFAEEIKWC